METSEIIVYGIAILNSIVLMVWRGSIQGISKKLDKLSADDDRIENKVNILAERVTKIETINDERLHVISDMHKHIIAMNNQITDLRTHYDESIRRFFEDYDLKRKP